MRRDDTIRKLLEDPTYDVRNDGTIWTTRSRNGRGVSEWRQTGLSETSKGYLSASYAGVTFQVHRAVYLKYNGPLLDGYELDHKDDNKKNNTPSNLQQILPVQNNRKKKNRKISFDQALEIRSLYSVGNIKQEELANLFGIDQTYVSDIIRRKCFK